MNDIYLYAKHYRKLGLNVTCVSNIVTEHNFYCKTRLKSPCHSYSNLFSEKQSDEEFESYNWKQATGVGFTSGYNKFCTIDIDGCSSYAILQETLKVLKLPSNYEWVIQSGGKNGFHIIVNMESDPRIYGYETVAVNTYNPLRRYQHLFEKIELLWRANSMLPPSIHPSSNKYSFIHTNLPKQLPLPIDAFNLAFFIETYFDGEGVTGVHYSDEMPTGGVLTDLEETDLEKHKNSDLFVLIDTETDGLIKEGVRGRSFPNVIQIAWLIMDKAGTIYKKESRLINPGILENSAFHINNISLEMIHKIGVHPREVYIDLLKDIHYAKYVVAHNIDFDIPIIENELLKHGLQKLPASLKKICTMKSSVNICRIPGGHPYKFPKLSELFNHLFKTKFNELHNAESDVMATAMCFRKMISDNLI